MDNTLHLADSYVRNCLVISVYDGDTFTGTIDLGFNINLIGQKIRLAAIDTPELRGGEREAGLIARDFLRSIILDKQIVLKSLGKGKYGRWIGLIWHENICINKLLVDEGYAIDIGLEKVLTFD